MVVKKILLSILLISSLLNADIFEKGGVHLGVSLGIGSTSYSGTYTVAGVSANYFVLDGLSVGAGYRGWFGIDPMRNELSLASTYYIPVSEMFRPYVGAFVRETFVSGYDNYASVGARGGLSIVSGKTYFSVGYAYEQFSNCIFAGECYTSYPELVFGVSF